MSRAAHPGCDLVEGSRRVTTAMLSLRRSGDPGEAQAIVYLLANGWKTVE
jgi:hypothetical protein